MDPMRGPGRTLTVADAVLLTVGIVVGAGIFRAPSLVAGNAGSDAAFLLLWVVGGLVALVGALCYAELAASYPSAGGDYHFLARAFGRRLAFLFGWARLAVMQTGSIALLAFVFGDYMTTIAPLGPASAAVWAALAVATFTAVNLVGIRPGKRTQGAFTIVEVAGVAALGLAGLVLQASAAAPPAPVPVADAAAPAGSLGLALVFVLLTYGGWNEAAYVSAEVRGGHAIARALVGGVLAISALYLLVNVAYLQVLGRAGIAASDAVAASLVERLAGPGGAAPVALLVAVSALTSLNATVITGARSNYALGRDFPRLGFLGVWDERRGTPTHALLAQGAIALALVGLGAATRSGFSTIVEFTAPVFWFFFLLTGVALFRLRRIDPGRARPFRVPLYPLLPLLFCASSAWMLWSSLAYAGIGALVGVAALALGLPVLAWALACERGRPPVPVNEGESR